MSNSPHPTGNKKEGSSTPIPPPVAQMHSKASAQVSASLSHLLQTRHGITSHSTQTSALPYSPPKPDNHTPPVPSLSREPTPRLSSVATVLKQKTIPITYQQYSTNENRSTTESIFTVDLDITARNLQAEVMERMRVTTATHLVYSFTGVPKSESDPKPFDTVAAVTEALDGVHKRIARAQTKIKGLKIINSDPAPKSKAFLDSLAKPPKEKDKLTARKKRTIAEIEALNAEDKFTVQLLQKWPRCRNGPCHNVHCYVSDCGLHIPLTHEATHVWSMAYRENPTKVDLDTPPSHALFQPSLVGIQSAVRKPVLLDTNKKPKHEPKVAGQLPIERCSLPDLKAKGDSVADPIEIDFETPGAGPSSRTNSPPSRPVPELVSTVSTRLPSPAELFKLMFPRIGFLLRELETANPNLHILDYAPRFRAAGVERIDQVPEYSVNWIANNIQITVLEASLIHSSALCYLRK
ncbi:hypothetical protein RSOL_198750, partial [Rhizoctonia solani AG-3 Rhs1AP]